VTAGGIQPCLFSHPEFKVEINHNLIPGPYFFAPIRIFIRVFKSMSRSTSEVPLLSAAGRWSWDFSVIFQGFSRTFPAALVGREPSTLSTRVFNADCPSLHLTFSPPSQTFFQTSTELF